MRKKTYLSVLALTWMGLTSNAQGTFTVDLSSTNGMSDFGSLFYNVLSGPIPVQTGDTISISYTIPNASDPFSGLVFTDRLALGGGTPPHRLSNPSLWGFTLNATPSFIGPDLTTMTAEYTITSTYGNYPSISAMYFNTTPGTVTIGITPAPEPSTLALAGLGGFGLLLLRWKIKMN